MAFAGALAGVIVEAATAVAAGALACNAVAAVAGARMPFCTSVAAVIPLTAGA